MDAATTFAARWAPVSATVAVAGASAPAAAQTPEEFYKGKTVTVMLGHPPGGSYHMYATLAANHLKRHIPGNPNVIIEHRPGGGGVRAARHFYTNAPRDGSVIALFPETLAHTEILQPEVGQWKTLEMNYIGNLRRRRRRDDAAAERAGQVDRRDAQDHVERRLHRQDLAGLSDRGADEEPRRLPVQDHLRLSGLGRLRAGADPRRARHGVERLAAMAHLAHRRDRQGHDGAGDPDRAAAQPRAAQSAADAGGGRRPDRQARDRIRLRRHVVRPCTDCAAGRFRPTGSRRCAARSTAWSRIRRSSRTPSAPRRRSIRPRARNCSRT